MNERKTVRRQEELQDCIRGARNLLKEQKRKGVTNEYYQEQANKTRQRISIYAQELADLVGHI